MAKWSSGSHAFKMEIIYGRQSSILSQLATHLHFRQLTKDLSEDNASSKNKPSELSYEALVHFVILNCLIYKIFIMKLYGALFSDLLLSFRFPFGCIFYGMCNMAYAQLKCQPALTHYYHN